MQGIFFLHFGTKLIGLKTATSAIKLPLAKQMWVCLELHARLFFWPLICYYPSYLLRLRVNFDTKECKNYRLLPQNCIKKSKTSLF